MQRGRCDRRILPHSSLPAVAPPAPCRSSRASVAATLEVNAILVPRKTRLAELTLEDSGVRASVNIIEYHVRRGGAHAPADADAGSAARCRRQIDFMPFDSDLLSLDMPMAFRDCVAYRDTANLFDTARSLVRLQLEFGTIPVLYGKVPADRSHVLHRRDAALRRAASL